MMRSMQTCERLRVDERRRAFGLNLDLIERRDETGGHVGAALWEHDFGDGHAFEVVYAVRESGGVAFWHVTYADDVDGPEGERIATTEQGLFYWLFFWLVQSEFSRRGEGAYSTLAAAAKAVGFEQLVDVFRLEEEIGSDYGRRGELVERSLGIGDSAR